MINHTGHSDLSDLSDRDDRDDRSQRTPQRDRSVCVGVTGHRPAGLEGADYGQLRTRIVETLGLIQAATGMLHVVVNSPIAEGSDRLVARAAVQLGHELRCVLPFGREEYKRDFSTDASRAEYVSLLDSATIVVELNGSRTTPEHADAAYAAAGHWVIEHSDAVIAIWDGRVARGSGGTGDIVRLALERNVPVLWIASRAPHERRLLTGAHEDDVIEQPQTALADILAARFSRTPAK